jgi:hypothetical protein
VRARQARRRRAGVGLVVLGLLGLVLPASAQAQSCNADGTACIDTPGPLAPPQVIEFRIEPEPNPNYVNLRYVQPRTGASGLVDAELVTAGPPGGLDSYRAVLPAAGTFYCTQFCSDQIPFSDAPITIEIHAQRPPAVAPATLHSAQYDLIAPVVNMSAEIVRLGPDQLQGRFASEPRREIEVDFSLFLHGRRKPPGEGYKSLGGILSTNHAVGSDGAASSPVVSGKCPRRFKKCRAYLVVTVTADGPDRSYLIEYVEAQRGFR